MTGDTDRLDQLADTSRQNASGIESLRATITAIVSRLDGIEGRLEEIQTAQVRSASSIETMRHEMSAIETMDARLSRQRDEMAAGFASQEHSLSLAVTELRRRIVADTERVSRDIAPFELRLREVEKLPEGLKSLERRHTEILGQVASLESHLESVAIERTAIEETVRLLEDRIQSRLAASDREAAEVRSDLSTWQERIESQDRLVRQAEAVAAAMENRVEELRRDQHELSENQRLWEARIDSTLDTHRSEADETWRAFHKQRDQDWSRNAHDTVAANERIDELVAELDAAREMSSAIRPDMEQLIAEAVESGLELRRQLLEAIGQWAEVSDLLSAAVASALPEDERPLVVEERRRALREAARARRGPGSG